MPSASASGVCHLGWLLLVVLAGCESPFATKSHEYGPRVPPHLLRSIEVLQLPERSEDSEEPEDRERWDDRLRRLAPPEGVERIELSIEQARAWTLENNLDLQVVLLDPEIAETFITEAEAAFEAAFFGSVVGSDARRGRSELFKGQIVRPFEAEPGVRIPLRTGGVATVSLPLAREEGFFQDRYWTDVEVSLLQPLLRGAGRATATHPIRIAAIGSQIAASRTKLEVIRQVADVDRAYWLLYEAEQVLNVRQEQYEHASAQLEQSQARFEGRLGPEIEVVRAEAGVARRLASIIIAQLEVQDRQRELKRILNLPGVDVDSPIVLELVSGPEAVQYELDPNALIDLALLHRMELLELELQLAVDASVVDFEKNQRLPLFLLDYTYRVSGSAGSFGRAVDHARRAENHGWRLGLHVDIPIGNEAAQARVHRALLARLQRLSTRSAREQAIKQEVLDAVDNLEATWQRILAARQSVLLEARNYRAEQGQFQLGLRTSTEVLDAETRLAEARIAEVTALTDYQIARIDAAFATGMLLGAARITW